MWAAFIFISSIFLHRLHVLHHLVLSIERCSMLPNNFADSSILYAVFSIYLFVMELQCMHLNRERGMSLNKVKDSQRNPQCYSLRPFDPTI